MMLRGLILFSPGEVFHARGRRAAARRRTPIRAPRRAATARVLYAVLGEVRVMSGGRRSERKRRYRGAKVQMMRLFCAQQTAREDGAEASARVVRACAGEACAVDVRRYAMLVVRCYRRYGAICRHVVAFFLRATSCIKIRSFPTSRHAHAHVDVTSVLRSGHRRAKRIVSACYEQDI